ncbi:MAG: EAL domain-containing protein [Sphingobium sp.]|nr:EAL domain-containing protein [Sphingobium sp.]
MMVVANRKVQEADIHRALVETLYASPASLAIGALAGLVISMTMAFISRDLLVWISAGMISLIALGRIISAVYYYRQKRSQESASYHFWGNVYELGAWAYAAMLGVQAFVTLIRFDDPAIHMLSVLLAVGYAAGIAGRNAGRVEIAVGQVCLALLPTAAGLWLAGGQGYHVLAVILLVMVLGMAEISRTTHRIVVEALRGKRQKSLLATKYERLARQDSLTGIENRMAMQIRLRDAFDASDSPQDRLAVLWMDLDRFKEVNDSQGHMMGDALLITVAEKISALLAGRGYVARFGGDEFVILCPGVGLKEAQPLADDILATFGCGVDVGPHHLPVTASIGIAVGPQDGQDVDELLQHADLALYEAKTRGRNCAVPFARVMKERFNRIHEIERGLRLALEQEELAVWFQPIFDVQSGQIHICEALLRWRHPVLGAVSPGEFIPIAESMGLIEAITHYVIRQACREAVNWPEDVRVAVNISPISLRSGELPSAIISALLESGLAPSRLELEVTESIFLHDDGQTHQMLQDLQKIGLRMVLDDFGTGYSSLSYLRSYRFDSIKIDRCFLRGIVTSREDQAIVRAVGHMADALDMEIVAEGIETIEQLDYVRLAGIHNVQGFLMSPARTADEVMEMIAQGIRIKDAMARRRDEIRARCA